MTNANIRKLPLMGNIYLFSVLTFLLSVVTLIPDIHLLELFSHFRFHYLLASVFFGLIFLYLRRYPLMLALCFCSVLNASLILPWYFDRNLASGKISLIASDSVNSKDLENSDDLGNSIYAHNNTRIPLKIVHFNLLSRNTQYKDVLNFVSGENPDIFVAQEVNQLWKQELETLSAYPYRYILAREDNFGIAVLSQHPWESLQERYWGDSSVPSLLIRIMIDGSLVNMIATHPLPPVNNQYYRQRNRQLEAMTSDIHLLSGPLMVVGDLNITMWSSDRSILSNINLANARQGFGLNPTWPAKFGILGIPIDHILVSSEFQVTSFATGPNLGSDHLPVISELKLKH